MLSNDRAQHGWVWFDLENTPQVLLFEPFVRHLEDAGWTVRVSAKPQAQTVDLVRLRGLSATVVGLGDFRGRFRKLGGGLARALRLVSWTRTWGKPRLLVSSSRSATLAAWLRQIPAVTLLDYEHAHHSTFLLGQPTVWMPDLLRGVEPLRRLERVAHYFEGLKENLYLDRWGMNRADERGSLGVDPNVRLVVARPPATTAHYADRAGFDLWAQAVTALSRRPEVKVIVTPRTPMQAAEVHRRLGDLTAIRIIEHVVSGPGMVAAADLVIGGGGTMNREAAVLGVPVWSSFTGPPPRIDEHLAVEGRLRWIREQSELDAALCDPLPPRRQGRGPYPRGLEAVRDAIDSVLGLRNGRS